VYVLYQEGISTQLGCGAGKIGFIHLGTFLVMYSYLSRERVPCEQVRVGVAPWYMRAHGVVSDDLRFRVRQDIPSGAYGVWCIFWRAGFHSLVNRCFSSSSLSRRPSRLEINEGKLSQFAWSLVSRDWMKSWTVCAVTVTPWTSYFCQKTTATWFNLCI